MKIKNFRGWLAMFSITLLIVFVFTACEEKPGPIVPDPDPPVENPTPIGVDSLKAGALSETSIRIQWRHSPDVDSVWFKEYVVEVVPTGTSLMPVTFAVPKTHNSITINEGLENGRRYTFTVKAVSDSGKVSNSRSIEWATSRYFNILSDGTPIRIYGSASTQFGSGLRLYNPTVTPPGPSRHMVSAGAQWNLGLHTSGTGANTVVKFGSASEIAKLYTNFSGTPEDAYITDVLHNQAALGGIMHDKDLSKLTFSKKAINLHENTNDQAAVFFARVGSGATAHYAKVIVRKNQGNFLQGTGNDRFIEVVISYQTAAGVPYAKIFAGK